MRRLQTEFKLLEVMKNAILRLKLIPLSNKFRKLLTRRLLIICELAKGAL